jgi:hypothetical protein
MAGVLLLVAGLIALRNRKTAVKVPWQLLEKKRKIDG